jgi:outer membrane protein insertion porin family
LSSRSSFRPATANVWFLWPVLVVVGLLWAHAAGQETEGPLVTRVEFVGLDRVKASYAQGVAQVEPGDHVDERVLDGAVARLLRTGRFWAVAHRTVQEPGGVAVIFEVRERPTIEAVRFEGNKKIRDGALRGLVDIKEGDLVDRFAVNQGRDAIAARYRQRGYNDVQVTYDEEALRDRGLLIYRIEEGVRVRISKILFEGNESFTRSQLKRQIETKPAFWFIRRGTFDRDRVESDAARLQKYYRDEGFLDARVSYRTEPDESGEKLVLVFTITEGTRYVIEDIRIEGRTAFSEEELRALMRSKPGQFVRRPDLDADVAAIRSLYGEYGYIYVVVRDSVIFSAEPGLVRVTFQIEEGEQYRVGRIVVRGNTRTKDKVVRRELDMYPPDDLWNLKAAQEAEDQLRDSRLFDSARVYPVGDEPGVRDVIIDVKEAEKTGDFLFGAGITSNSGVIGSLVLDLRNFDLFDVPRDLDELVSFRSFFGGGQRLRLELQPGTELSQVRVDFNEPYFLDRPVSFSVGGWLWERGRDGYDEQRTGGTVSFGKRFIRGPLVGWYGRVSFRAEVVTIDDPDLFVARDIRDVEGDNFITTAEISLVRDRTDNRLVPTKGDRLRFSYEQAGALGGDFSFAKLMVGYTWHKTVARDLLDRPSVLSLRGDVGQIIGDAPVFERFYAGGMGTLRGFAHRGVGPYEGIDETNVGGDFLLLLGANYTFPLVGEVFRGVLFVDTGMVDSGFRASVGAGIRLTLNIFGPVPLEFNLGFPVLKESDDETQVFSFSIGTTF